MDTRHVKLSFYLDPLRAETGAVRLMPGTSHWESDYARTLRAKFRNIGNVPETYGVESPDVPCIVVESDPGDLVLWDFRTIHAAYFGQPRRRLFTLNFREARAAQA
jgi:ectoine hydroxylase-related dioxygenase (phytanoyl-CoA dioxygenase family)